jgi:hypothetical protein
LSQILGSGPKRANKRKFAVEKEKAVEEKLQEHLLVTLILIAMCFGFAYCRPNLAVLGARIMGQHFLAAGHKRNDDSKLLPVFTPRAAHEAWECTKDVLSPREQLLDLLRPPAAVLLQHFLKGVQGGPCGSSNASLKYNGAAMKASSLVIRQEIHTTTSWKQYDQSSMHFPTEFTLKQLEQKPIIVVRPIPKTQQTFDDLFYSPTTPATKIDEVRTNVQRISSSLGVAQ